MNKFTLVVSMKCSTVDIYSLVQKLIPKLTRNDVPCVQRLWVNKHDYVINRSTLLTLEMHLNVMIIATRGGYGYIRI